jgi:hypothetical protein
MAMMNPAPISGPFRDVNAGKCRFLIFVLCLV